MPVNRRDVNPATFFFASLMPYISDCLTLHWSKVFVRFGLECAVSSNTLGLIYLAFPQGEGESDRVCLLFIILPEGKARDSSDQSGATTTTQRRCVSSALLTGSKPVTFPFRHASLYIYSTASIIECLYTFFTNSSQDAPQGILFRRSYGRIQPCHPVHELSSASLRLFHGNTF